MKVLQLLGSIYFYGLRCLVARRNGGWDCEDQRGRGELQSSFIPLFVLYKVHKVVDLDYAVQGTGIGTGDACASELEDEKKL